MSMFDLLIVAFFSYFFRNGNLCGATTAKDLSLFIKNPTLQALQGNIFDYLKLIRQEQINVCLVLVRVSFFLLLRLLIHVLLFLKVKNCPVLLVC